MRYNFSKTNKFMMSLKILQEGICAHDIFMIFSWLVFDLTGYVADDNVHFYV